MVVVGNKPLRLRIGISNLKLLGDEHKISYWKLKPEIVDWFEDSNISYEYIVGVIDFTCKEDMVAFKLRWL